MSNIFIDWLTVTFPFDMMGVKSGFAALDSDAEIFLAKLYLPTTIKPAIPHFGYTQAWGLGNGGVVMYSPFREDMGVSVTLPGSFLADYNWRDILVRAVDRGKIARLDVTLDVHNPDFDLEGLYSLVDAGQAETRARSVSFIQSKTGQTLYVGKRGGDRMLRIYDKGGEMGGVVGEHWRIEAELKGAVAHSAALRLLRNTDEGFGMFKSILNCPLHPGYTEAIGNTQPLFAFQTTKRRRDTEAWLFGLVARTMAQQEKLAPGTLELFVKHVSGLLT